MGYNLLTQRILEEGYTVDNHPDYVKLPGSCWGESPLQNLNDGFVYTNEYRNKMVFKTGCGLFVKGSYFNNGHMSYAGKKWIIENDCPTITCPYRKDSCGLRDPILGPIHVGGLSKLLFCDCHRTEELYDNEKSLDKAIADQYRERKRKYDEFADKKRGRVCHWHMKYSEWTGEWKQNYDPMICARSCMNIGHDCDITRKPISKKRGNVFYDVKVSYIRNDGTLFDGQEVVKITKGVRLFETGKSLSICEQVVKRCKKQIEDKEYNKRHAEILMLGWKVEVLNIRAEQRESRDLMQDLQDIQEGIQITHASDVEKKNKTYKKERRQQAQENKIKKLEKKLIETGYYNLEKHSLERRHADKWLGEDRIAELEREREKRRQEEKNKPVQLSLFDMEGMQ